MMQNKSRLVPPRATAMIEALRGLGYSTATAIADIIDNSIAASATKVDILVKWRGNQSTISILDNGKGMNDSTLERAMRVGEKNPLDTRDKNDLGRFGLGLKTASFSQCRRLTVASKIKEDVSCLRWDLDVLEKSTDDGWYLLEGIADGSQHLLEPLQSLETGTIVIWETMDRIVTAGFKDQDLLDLLDVVERHLSMVFHRFLERTRDKLVICINGQPIKPWNPFHLEVPGYISPILSISTPTGAIEVQGYVLPHKDRLNNVQYEAAGGPEGWNSQQGFYVYRNERLLLAGSWLGLGLGRSWHKEEAHRLARIRLDINNSSDADWKIDIRKSTARPPVAIRAQLTRFAEDIRSRARRVFAHRGQSVRIGESHSLTQAWKSEHFNGGMRYRIDSNHPAVREVLDEAGALAPQIEAMLRILEETIPVQRIWLDTTEAKETPLTQFNGAPSSEIEAVLNVMFTSLTRKRGLSAEAARKKLSNTEPFQNYPDLITALADKAEGDL